MIKEFQFSIKNQDYLNNMEKNHDNIMNMVYEDKHSKKYYILMVRDNNLEFIEIRLKYENDYEIKNFFESKNDLKQFTEIINEKLYFKGCVVNSSNNNYNTDYLYLYFTGETNFIIIDLLNKKIIKKIELNKDIISIVNWNNKYLILQAYGSFYIYDTRIDKIITEYSNLLEFDFIKSIKTFFSIKNNFYCYFVNKGIINFFISN